jgi:AcrR family transcriptional regulator
VFALHFFALFGGEKSANTPKKEMECRKMANEELKSKNLDHALLKSSELMLTYGIEGTSKEMIARASQLSVRTIDRYFARKEDAVIQTANYLSNMVWSHTSKRYPTELFESGKLNGLEILEVYMKHMKEVFQRYPKLFVFYYEFKIYFSRHTNDYHKQYNQLMDGIGCQRIIKKIFTYGVDDGSMKAEIEPNAESEYFCKSFFSFLANSGVSYEYDHGHAISQIDKYIARIIYLYRNNIDAVDPEIFRLVESDKQEEENEFNIMH